MVICVDRRIKSPSPPSLSQKAGDIGELRLLDGTDRRLRVLGTEKPYEGGVALRIAPVGLANGGARLLFVFVCIC